MAPMIMSHGDRHTFNIYDRHFLHSSLPKVKRYRRKADKYLHSISFKSQDSYEFVRPKPFKIYPKKKVNK